MLEFACGRSGRGKTQYIFDGIKTALAQQTGERIYLIVPDQMSFQTEYALLQQIPNKAMMRVEVVGISRFITQMISHLNGTNYRVFDGLAQKILLLQAGMAQKKELDVYANVVEKPEFITYLQQFSRALKGTGLVFNEALPYAELKEDYPLLFKKMQETDRIFSYYQEQLEPLVFDVADKMRHYLSLLRQPENQEKLKKINVYIDGFYTFNNLEVEVLSETLRYVNEGRMTFAFDVRDRIKPNSIFWLIQKQFQKFSEKLNPSCVRIDITNHRFAQTPMLSFIERNYEQPQRLIVPEGKKSPLDVSVYETIEQEIIGVAQAIRQKIVFEDVRAKEIALYLPKKELYTPVIEKYFALYGIPYYFDLKDSMLIHPIFNWLHTLLQIIKSNWQMDDILALLSNDFFRYKHKITDEEYYLFVDFVAQMKYPYKHIWDQGKYWLYYDRPDRLEDSLNKEKTKTIHRIKTVLRDTIRTFATMFEHENGTNEDQLRTLFAYIQGQNVYTYINKAESRKIEAKYLSHVTEAQYQETVWKQLIYLFDQIHVAIGQETYQKDIFLPALLLGLEESEFTSVPQSFDAVMIGDFARTKFQTLHQENGTKMGVQYAYILGVNDQFVPQQDEGIGMLAPAELEVMQAQGVLTDILLQDEAMNYQRFHFYTLLTSAAKEVHVSYYRYDGLYLEEEHFPSAVLKPLIDVVGVPLLMKDAEEQENNLKNMSLLAAKQMLMREYNRHAKAASPLWKVLEGADPLFIESLDKVSKFKNNVQVSGKIPLPDLFSVSQIETYNRCAYQYFLTYILKIKAPYEEKIQPFQTGILLHGAYELLAQKAEKAGVKVSELGDVNELVTRYFGTIEKALSTHPLFNVMSNKYMYDQTQKIVEQSLSFMMRNESLSSFVPAHIEYQLPKQTIKLPNGEAQLIGKLDRIDFDMKGEHLRIIDYKSSRQTLDFNALLNGTQLQLPVYTYLTSQTFQAKFAGSLYVPIVEHDVLVDTPRVEADEITTKLQKNYQATGFVMNEDEQLLLFDSQLAEQDKSTVITYDRNKDGSAGVHSMVLSAEEATKVQDFAMDQVQAALTHIVDQDFSITPLREDYDSANTACKRCAFRSICQFDRTINSYNEREKRITELSFARKKDKFLDIIAREKENTHE